MISTWTIRACSVIAVAALVPHPSSAQSARSSPTAQDSTWRPHFRLGGGTVSGAGPMGLAGIDWQRQGSRFSLRATVDYSQRELRHPLFFNGDGSISSARDCTGYCIDRSTRKIGGASIDAKFDLLTGRFRPYVFSGFGLYRAVDTDYANAKCDNSQFQCVLTPGELHPNTFRSVPKALQAGLGTSFRIGRIELFGEMSWRALSNRYQGQDWLGPTTFGIRF
jgi:hypothetical protein